MNGSALGRASAAWVNTPAPRSARPTMDPVCLSCAGAVEKRVAFGAGGTGPRAPSFQPGVPERAGSLCVGASFRTAHPGVRPPTMGGIAAANPCWSWDRGDSGRRVPERVGSPAPAAVMGTEWRQPLPFLRGEPRRSPPGGVAPVGEFAWGTHPAHAIKVDPPRAPNPGPTPPGPGPLPGPTDPPPGWVWLGCPESLGADDVKLCEDACRANGESVWSCTYERLQPGVCGLTVACTECDDPATTEPTAPGGDEGAI